MQHLMVRKIRATKIQLCPRSKVNGKHIKKARDARLRFVP
jgi:hypothetical protein